MNEKGVVRLVPRWQSFTAIDGRTQPRSCRKWSKQADVRLPFALMFLSKQRYSARSK